MKMQGMHLLSVLFFLGGSLNLFTMRKNINNVNLNSTMIGGLRLSHLSLYFYL